MHDPVRFLADVTPRATDDAVIELAARDGRVLLTEDKDFGQLVYAGARSSSGVILVRFPASARSSLADGVLEFVLQRGDSLAGGFAVVQPGRVRIARGPGA